jgi:hypothetical protein
MVCFRLASIGRMTRYCPKQDSPTGWRAQPKGVIWGRKRSPRCRLTGGSPIRWLGYKQAGAPLRHADTGKDTGKVVGRLTSVAIHPTTGAWRALASVHRDARAMGERLQVVPMDESSSGLVEATVSLLPFAETPLDSPAVSNTHLETAIAHYIAGNAPPTIDADPRPY